MQILLNVVLAITAVLLLALMLLELHRSLSVKAIVDAMPQMLSLHVDLRRHEGAGIQRVTYHGESLQELQELQDFLNAFSMFRIVRACVWDKGTMTHVMQPSGVLEAI